MARSRRACRLALARDDDTPTGAPPPSERRSTGRPRRTGTSVGVGDPSRAGRPTLEQGAALQRKQPPCRPQQLLRGVLLLTQDDGLVSDGRSESDLVNSDSGRLKEMMAA